MQVSSHLHWTKTSCTNQCASGTLLLDCAANIWIVLTHATAMMPRANRLGPSRFHKPWRSSCRAMDKDIAPSRYNTLERRRRKIHRMDQYCAAPQTLSTSQLPKQTRGQDCVKNGDKSFAGHITKLLQWLVVSEPLGDDLQSSPTCSILYFLFCTCVLLFSFESSTSPSHSWLHCGVATGLEQKCVAAKNKTE